MANAEKQKAPVKKSSRQTVLSVITRSVIPVILGCLDKIRI